jgi:hypothetical protein
MVDPPFELGRVEYFHILDVEYEIAVVRGEVFAQPRRHPA